MEFLWKTSFLISVVFHLECASSSSDELPVKDGEQTQVGCSTWNALEGISVFAKTTRQNSRISTSLRCLDSLFLYFLIGNRGLTLLTCLKGGDGTCWLLIFKLSLEAGKSKSIFRAANANTIYIKTPICSIERQCGPSILWAGNVLTCWKMLAPQGLLDQGPEYNWGLYINSLQLWQIAFLPVLKAVHCFSKNLKPNWNV